MSKKKREKDSRRLWGFKRRSSGVLKQSTVENFLLTGQQHLQVFYSLISYLLALFNPIHILKSYTWIVIIFYFICYLFVGKYTVLESPFYTVKRLPLISNLRRIVRAIY
jgi:hypothetical protein